MIDRKIQSLEICMADGSQDAQEIKNKLEQLLHERVTLPTNYGEMTFSRHASCLRFFLCAYSERLIWQGLSGIISSTLLPRHCLAPAQRLHFPTMLWNWRANITATWK